MVRLYEAEIENEVSLLEDGRIEQQFYMLAESFESAVVLARDVVRQLQEQLHKKARFRPSAEFLDIRSIRDIGAIVGATSDIGELVETITAQLRTNMAGD